MIKNFIHKPVLLHKVIDVLEIKQEKKYIDATIGGGGYTEAILEKGGIVLGIDADLAAFKYVKEKFKNQSSKFKIEENIILVRDNFANIEKVAKENNFTNVDGIVFDLGVSSYQLEQSGRGFSFLREEPLDMRMDISQGITAFEIINSWNKEELYDLFTKMGEERFSLAIIDNIIRARRIKPIETSLELAKIVEDVAPRIGKIHPATKVFLALRIFVNQELKNLKVGLIDGFSILKSGGKMAIVSFHSLEDRIVKEEFNKLEKMKTGKILTKKPVIADEEEIAVNARARSAKMRVIEKT